MLIDAGAKLRCCDQEKVTPLHYACAEGNVKITQMLFEAAKKRGGQETVSKVSGM